MAEGFSIELELIGARLRSIRKHRKLKLLDLQVSCGIQDSKISRIERGLENIEIHTIYKLAKALKVGLIEIFDYDGELPDNSNFRIPVKKSRKRH